MSLKRLYTDFLAGLTTAFALVPECIAFALVAHLNPLMGLYGAFVICTLTALLGGRPGMVSGAAGSMAVVIVALVVQHGVQYLLATVLLGGVIMISFGLLRLGKLVRMVPYPVMLGFVNGLAIVIAMSQLEHFKSGGKWLTGVSLYWMAGLVTLTIAIVCLLPKFNRTLPSALVAILSVGLCVYLLDIPTRTLGDIAHIAGGLPSISLPDVPWSFETLKIITPYALLMALVGLVETLLTLNITDEITETRGYPNRECIALGVANIASSAVGGMGGCAMIGQTAVNLSSGGRGRLSGVTAGIAILLFVLFLSPLIEGIPLAALVGVMFVVSLQTFSWASLRTLNKVPLSDTIVIFLVSLITVLTDLATAVVCGVIIAALNFSWQHAKQLYADTHFENEKKVYRLHGTLFFASITDFLNQFSPAIDPDVVILDCQHLTFVDYSAIAALSTLRERYVKAGKSLKIVHLSERCRKLLKRAHPYSSTTGDCTAPE